MFHFSPKPPPPSPTPLTAELLLETLQHYPREGNDKLQAFVLMPDHHDPRKGPAPAGPKRPGPKAVPLCRRPEWNRRRNDHLLSSAPPTTPLKCPHGAPTENRQCRYLLHHHRHPQPPRLFQVDANATLFIQTLQHYRREGLYKLHAFVVVMPDHVHLLLTTIDLATAMQRIKGGFSHRLASNFPAWQRGYTDHLIRNRADFLTHLNYLHHNPVRVQLCQLSDQYPYSSAHRNPTQTLQL